MTLGHLVTWLWTFDWTYVLVAAFVGFFIIAGLNASPHGAYHRRAADAFPTFSRWVRRLRSSLQ